ncbi:MAG: WbuC family cupin fold metalloprotein [Elusimicrobiota bacterium]
MIPKELAALKELGLVEAPGGKSPAFTATGDRLLDARAFEALKALVKDTPGATVRINLHPGPEAPVHDMVIAQSAGGKPFVHKHLSREETYHMISGRMRLQFFDEAGKPTASHLLGAIGAGLPLIVRVPKGVWHATQPETDFAVFHESRPGPFDGSDTVLPAFNV